MIRVEISIKEFCSIFKININQYYQKRFNKFLPTKHKKTNSKYKKVILAKLDVDNSKIIFKTKNNTYFDKTI